MAPSKISDFQNPLQMEGTSCALILKIDCFLIESLFFYLKICFLFFLFLVLIRCSSHFDAFGTTNSQYVNSK